MPSKLKLGGELLYPSNYLSAADLGGKTEAVVTISEVNSDELKLANGKLDKKKLIIGFKGAKKKMVCNVTNANTLVFLFGENAEAFVGKRITIYATKTNFKGDMVDCLRIRDKVPTDNNKEGMNTNA